MHPGEPTLPEYELYLRGNLNTGVSASLPSKPLGKMEQAQMEQELEADASKEEQLYSEVQVGLQGHTRWQATCNLLRCLEYEQP